MRANHIQVSKTIIFNYSILLGFFSAIVYLSTRKGCSDYTVLDVANAPAGREMMTKRPLRVSAKSRQTFHLVK